MTSEGKIQAIDVNTVHRICSGQVVLSLAVAVKELVENSLDGGATSIEVRFSDHGKELVEVSDNGCGISGENFESLCLKHYTSKIQNFEDVALVETFGFRGEALSSLCALSRVTVFTCTKNDKIGWKLEYDTRGRLERKTQHPRQAGTTVLLHELFSTLPVRHKEFTRNIRREFDKAVNLLSGYCLISRNTRFTCINICNGKRTSVLSTHGSNSVLNNITNIFGPKFVRSLLPIETIAVSEEILAQFGLNPHKIAVSDHFQLEGYVSSCVHGQGRSSGDRQFYFINGRPCDPSKLSKLVNEVYHSFNRDQYPCIVLNITVDRQSVDVNVTPDKRQLLLTNEKLLLATVKAALLKVFEKLPSTFAVQNISTCQRIFQTAEEDTAAEPVTDEPDGDPAGSPAGNGTIASRFVAGRFSRLADVSSGKRRMELPCPRPKQKCIDTFFKRASSSPVKQTTRTQSKDKEVMLLYEEPQAQETAIVEVNQKETSENQTESAVSNSDILEVIETEEQLSTVIDEILIKEEETVQPVVQYTSPGGELSRETVNLELDFQSLRLKLEEGRKTEKQFVGRKFFARIKPEDAADAEAELSRQIKKSDFAKMEVIGQFNLGFIIARLESDLFIVDQHAADEKYFFETLQKTTVIQSQRLVCPKALNLTAVNESLLIENLCIFRRNGFDFQINAEAEATNRVHLTAVPMSKNHVFGPSDVDELLFMLQDAPWGQITEEELTDQIMAQCRPSRVRSMFASRACHSATRVGDPLTHAQMKKLLEQMSQLNQPWNCPHGRPTMRHLLNLEMLTN